jgi:hypothetical protein
MFVVSACTDRLWDLSSRNVGVKCPERKTDHSCLPDVEIQKTGQAFAPPCRFVSRFIFLFYSSLLFILGDTQ